MTLQLLHRTLKTCSRCNLLVDLKDFSGNKANSDGLSYHCKACDKEYQSARRDADRPGLAKYHKNRRADKTENFEYRMTCLLNASRQRSRNKGREHSITLQDLLDLYPVDGKCPVFGMPLKFNKGVFRDDSPSIDRIDSDGGYTRDNIQIMSWKANRIKSSSTVEDLEALLAFMKQGD